MGNHYHSDSLNTMPGDKLNFKCAVITGGAGGIGRAMAEYFIANGKKVLLAGRTESNLQETSKSIGAAGYYVLDTGKTADIPSFVEKITKEHPELDCLVNNAGVQRPIEVVRMDAVDFLSKADQEIDINIRGPMHLALTLLPHLQSKPSATIINVSSVLGFVPFSIINPVYNGTNVRVVEIAPPMVETDLHRERVDPDDNKKEKNSMALSLKEFMDEISAKLENGDDMITAGPGNDMVRKWYDAYGGIYSQVSGGK